ncbi:MAG TPA: hypothetical protein VGD58_02825 [Herpetosiphonaceae bacterium]
MPEPLIIWSVFVLVVLAGCWLKPNATRILLGCFFIVMAIGFHIVLILVNPRAYDGFATTALLPIYRWIFRNLVSLYPLLFALFAAAFELTIALLMLNKRQYARLGLAIGSFFLLAITPLGVETLPNALLALGLAYLATQEFDTSMLEAVRARLHRHASTGIS